jgi:protein gp37
MSSTTSIEWCDTTWNPTTGCDRISAGCDNCYALTMARRLKAMGSAKYQRDGDPRTSGPGFGLSVHEDALTMPLRWRKPRKVFVNSTSDLFHDKVPTGFIADVFAVMAATPHHTYQVLTKRPGRMRSLLARPDFEAVTCDRWLSFARCGSDWVWPLPNVWLGCSVEDQKWANVRIPLLLDTPAVVRFVSCEPLLGPVDLQAADKDALVDGGLDWIIIGGESGRGARRMELAWAASLVEQGHRHPAGRVFVKQLGSAQGSHKGGLIEMWPPALRVREFPMAGRST